MSEQRTRRKSGLWPRPRGDKFEAVDIIEGNVLGIFDSLQAAVDALYGEGSSVEYRDGETGQMLFG